jgi:hypothetical protein
MVAEYSAARSKPGHPDWSPGIELTGNRHSSVVPRRTSSTQNLAQIHETFAKNSPLIKSVNSAGVMHAGVGY